MPRHEVDLRHLLWLGPVTVAASLLAVFLVQVIAFALLDLDPTYPPLTWQGLTMFTVFFVTMGVLVFVAVAWKARTPIRTYRRIALVALVLSFVPDFFLPGQEGVAGATWTAAIVLMVMHVAAWLPVQFVLTNPAYIGRR